jgi:hypothetical protein
MKSIFTLFVSMLLLTACTIITATNSPGKELSKIPAFMHGKYEMVFPSSINDFAGDQRTLLEIKEDGINMDTPEGSSFIALNDSLSVSKLGKEYFLNFGKTPTLSVMKVIKTGTGLELQGINAKEGVKEEQLKPYFSKVEVVSELDEESGEINESYHVTIDDKKLKKYFKSDIIYKEPFILKRVN